MSLSFPTHINPSVTDTDASKGATETPLEVMCLRLDGHSIARNFPGWPECSIAFGSVWERHNFKKINKCLFPRCLQHTQSYSGDMYHQCWCSFALQRCLRWHPHLTAMKSKFFWCLRYLPLPAHWFLVSIFVKVTGSLSGLCGPPVTAFLSLTKRASLYHDSSVFVLDSLPPGNPRPNRRLCDWLSDVLSWIIWSDFQTDVLHFVILTSPTTHTNATPSKLCLGVKIGNIALLSPVIYVFFFLAT